MGKDEKESKCLLKARSIETDTDMRNARYGHEGDRHRFYVCFEVLHRIGYARL